MSTAPLTAADWRHELEEVTRADLQEVVLLAMRAPQAAEDLNLQRIRVRLESDELRAYKHWNGRTGRAEISHRLSIVRGDLLDLVHLAFTVTARTATEQAALLVLASALDAQPFRLMEYEARDTHLTRLDAAPSGGVA